MMTLNDETEQSLILIFLFFFTSVQTYIYILAACTPEFPHSETLKDISNPFYSDLFNT